MIFFLWFAKLILNHYEPVAVTSVSHVYVSKWRVVAFQVQVCNRSTERNPKNYFITHNSTWDPWV